MTDEEFAEAKDELEQAIKKYANRVRPDSFNASEWVLIYSHQSVELSQEGMSSVVCTMPTGQLYWHSVGLLTTALDDQRFPGSAGVQV